MAEIKGLINAKGKGGSEGIPTIIIELSQMLTSNTAQLTNEQFDIINSNNVIYLEAPDGSASIFYQYHITGVSNLIFDSPHLDYDLERIEYYEISIDTSTKVLTYLFKSFSGGGKQLYEHNIQLSGQVGSDYAWFFVRIINDSPLPFVKHGDYVNGVNQSLPKFFEDNGFDGTDMAKMYMCEMQVGNNAGRYMGIGARYNTTYSLYYFKVWDTVATNSVDFVNTTLRGDIVRTL